MKRAAAVLLCLAAAACNGVPSALPIQPGTPCSQCRMTLLDPRLSSQLLAPGEEPRFFDDLGCLAAYLSAHPARDVTTYVADHATGEWVDASRAVFGRDEALATPMNSHLFAHASAAARAGDAGVRGTRVLTYAEVLGSGAAGKGRP